MDLGTDNADLGRWAKWSREVGLGRRSIRN